MGNTPNTTDPERIIMDTGVIGRFPNMASDALGLFYMAVGFFKGSHDNQYPYCVCLSSEHRAAVQEALGLVVDEHMVHRYELEIHTVICQAEKRPRQRRER